jgi:hypothetical protein
LHGYVVNQPLLNPILLTFYLGIASFFLLIPSFILKTKHHLSPPKVD